MSPSSYRTLTTSAVTFDSHPTIWPTTQQFADFCVTLPPPMMSAFSAPSISTTFEISRRDLVLEARLR